MSSCKGFACSGWEEGTFSTDGEFCATFELSFCGTHEFFSVEDNVSSTLACSVKCSLLCDRPGRAGFSPFRQPSPSLLSAATICWFRPAACLGSLFRLINGGDLAALPTTFSPELELPSVFPFPTLDLHGELLDVRLSCRLFS